MVILHDGNLTTLDPVNRMKMAVSIGHDVQSVKEMGLSTIDCSVSSATPRRSVPPNVSVADMAPPLSPLEQDSILIPARVREVDKELNAKTLPPPLSRTMSLIVVDVHERDPLPRLNRGVSEVVDVPDTPLIIIDVSVSVTADWISNRYFPVCMVSVIEMLKVLRVADAVVVFVILHDGNFTTPVPISVMCTPLFTPPDVQSVMDSGFSTTDCSESSPTPRMRVPPVVTVADIAPPFFSLEHDSILIPARVTEEDKEVNSNTPPLPLSRVMSLIVVDVQESNPLPRLNRGVSEVVDVPDTPLIIIDVSVSVTADWISNRYPPLVMVSVTNIVKVVKVAAAETGKRVEDASEDFTLSVTSAVDALDFVGCMIRSDLLSEMGAVSALYSPSYIFTVDALSPFRRA